MNVLRMTALAAAGSLLVFSLGCPPEDEPDPDPDDQEFEVELAGENQVPPVASPAPGEMTVEFEDDVLTIDGNFNSLVADTTQIEGSSAHIHEGAEGEDGPVLYNLDVTPEGERHGDFEIEQELTDEEVAMFDNDELYVNVHSEAYPGGELRGQIDEDAPEFADVTDDWGIEVTSEAHPDELDADAEGWAWNVLRDDDSFVSSGAINDLSSPVVEVALERETIGDEVASYDFEPREEEDDDVDNNNDEAAEVDEGVRFWLTEELDDEQVDALTDGDYYITVYTEEFEDDGEARGHIDDDAGFWDNIFGADEDPQAAPPF